MIDIENLPPGSKKDKNGIWRTSLGRLLPGQVLNPKGRKMDDAAKRFKELAIDMSQDTIRRVYEIAMDPNAKHSDVLKAAEMIESRSYGKTTTVIESEGFDLTPRTIIIGNLDDLEAEDAAILAEGEGLDLEE